MSLKEFDSDFVKKIACVNRLYPRLTNILKRFAFNEDDFCTRMQIVEVSIKKKKSILSLS